MTADEVKALHTTFNEFKSTNEKALLEVKTFGAVTTETKTKLDTLSTALDTTEAKINKRIDEEKVAKDAEVKVLKTRIDELEALIAKKAPHMGSEERKEAAFQLRKVFFKALTSGISPSVLEGSKQLSDEEFKMLKEAKVLQIGVDTQGGYLAPTDYIQEILKNVVQFSPIRALASVRSTTRQSISIPKRTQTVIAQWTADLGTRVETQNPAFGLETIPTHEMYAMTKVARTELEDSVFDLQAFLSAEFSEQFGVLEGQGFLTGTGVGQPEGVLTNALVPFTSSLTASQLNADDLIALFYSIKEQYLLNATWVWNRSTMKTIRQLKDGTGQYLWAAGIKTDARPATVLDRPYVTAPDMPSISSNNFPVLFGDFKRGLIVVDRLAMEMMMDPYTSKSVGMIEFSARQRVGAQIVIAEALAKLKIT